VDEGDRDPEDAPDPPQAPLLTTATVVPTPDADRLLVDLDPRSLTGVVAAGFVAMVVVAIASAAPEMVTRIAVGLVVGLALSPVATAIQRRWGTGRGAATAMVGVGLAIVFGVVLFLVGPPAVRQIEEFSQDVPDTVEELYSWPIIGPRLEEADARGQVEEWLDELPSRLDEETLGDVAERLLGGIVTAAIVLITALGVLFDGEQSVARVRTVIPARLQGRADRVGHVVYETFGSYFAGSLVVSVLNGLVILTAGLLLGVPLAPIAGLWAALTNLIPQIGGFLGGSFFVLLALTESPVKAAIAAGVFLLYQQFENNVIQPAVVGTAVNLSPPTTMLAALVGGAAAGVPGALVATPLLGAAKAVLLERQGRAPERSPSALRRLRLRGSPP
jgi:predicted PurR-regulated permease PerM